MNAARESSVRCRFFSSKMFGAGYRYQRSMTYPAEDENDLFIDLGNAVQPVIPRRR